MCAGAGIDVLFKHGRKLVGDRTAKSKLEVVRETETQFADDVALHFSSRSDFEIVAKIFVDMAKQWGLTVSTQKTKGIVVGEAVCDWDVGSVHIA